MILKIISLEGENKLDMINTNSQQYSASEIQVLEGLEAVKKTSWNVYRFNFPERSSPFGV